VGPPSLPASGLRDQAITQLQKAGASQPLTASLLASEALLHPLSIRVSTLNALVVLADGRLASGSDDHTIKIWDPTSAEPESNHPQFIADAAITSLAFLTATSTLVAGDASGRLHWLRLPGP
jgi:WD40 repeat protein